LKIWERKKELGRKGEEAETTSKRTHLYRWGEKVCAIAKKKNWREGTRGEVENYSSG